MPARRWRLQTRIAGLVTTGALVVLGPVSVAFADPGSPGRASAAAVSPSFAKATHHPEKAKKKPASGKSKRRSTKPVSRKTNHPRKKSAHKPGKRSTHTRKGGAPKHSNSPAIFKGRTSTPAPKPGKKAGKTKKWHKRSPRVHRSGTGVAPPARTPSVRSSPAPRPTSVTAPRTSTAPQPAPIAALVQPRTSLAPALAPLTTRPVRTAAAAPQSSRTRAASAPTQSSPRAAGVPVNKRAFPEAMGPVHMLQVLGANALELIVVIAGIGFAIAVGAIVTGYRGARRL